MSLEERQAIENFTKKMKDEKVKKKDKLKGLDELLQRFKKRNT